MGLAMQEIYWKLVRKNEGSVELGRLGEPSDWEGYLIWPPVEERGKEGRLGGSILDFSAVLRVQSGSQGVLKPKSPIRASLVAQWLRICLPMQETRVRALREDPTCRGATGPVRRSYWARVPGAHAPQQERPPQWEARAPQWRVAPALCNWREPARSGEDPTQPKIN